MDALNFDSTSPGEVLQASKHTFRFRAEGHSSADPSRCARSANQKPVIVSDSDFNGQEYTLLLHSFCSSRCEGGVEIDREKWKMKLAKERSFFYDDLLIMAFSEGSELASAAMGGQVCGFFLQLSWPIELLGKQDPTQQSHRINIDFNQTLLEHTWSGKISTDRKCVKSPSCGVMNIGVFHSLPCRRFIGTQFGARKTIRTSLSAQSTQTRSVLWERTCGSSRYGTREHKLDLELGGKKTDWNSDNNVVNLMNGRAFRANYLFMN